MRIYELLSYELMGVFFFLFRVSSCMVGYYCGGILDYRVHTTKDGDDTIFFVFAKTD